MICFILSYIRDVDIRPILRKKLGKSLPSDAVIIEEMSIPQHDNRIDLAVVNGSLHGFEIKSDADSLLRLPAQCVAYNSLFDEVTLVSGERHVDSAMKIVPDWWGVWLSAVRADGQIELLTYRETQPNPSPDASTIVRLLWRHEVEKLVKGLGLRSRTSHWYMHELNTLLVAEAPIDELRRATRLALKSRQEFVAPHASCGD